MNLSTALRKLEPRSEFSIITKMDPDKAADLLAADVNNEVGLFINNDKNYEGFISGRSFNLQRIGSKRDLRPRIIGGILRETEGTRVQVTIKLNIIALGILCIALTVGLVSILAFLISESKTKNEALLPLIPSVGTWLLFYLQVKYEASVNKNIFRWKFKGEVEK